jgi:hypothetical protein
MKPIRSFAIAIACAVTGAPVAMAATGAPDASVPEPTRLEHALTFATTGCGGAVLQTPQPGTQFASDDADMPAPARSFYALAAQHRVRWLSSIDCERTGRTHALIPAESDGKDAPGVQSVNTNYTSSNWSGYQFNHTARFVQATYIVPTVSNPTPGYSTNGYAASVWAGIGGGFGTSTSDPLIQSGTALQINGTVKTYYPWYEVVNGPSDTNGEIRINSLAAHAGDSVGTVSLWLSNTLQAEMGICNLSSGVCVQFYVPNTPAPGASTEWIVEAPTSGLYPRPLAKFGTVSFGNVCWASTYTPNSTVNCGAFTGANPIKLQQNVLGGYQTLAQPGAMAANGDFTDYYQQPQQIVICGRLGYPPCP